MRFTMPIRPARNEDFEEITKVWEASVTATHDFLSRADIAALREKIRDEYLPLVHLMLHTDKLGAIQGFIGVADRKIEMLFIAPELRGLGIGRALLEFAVSEMDAILVDVNEQNPDAIRFYERMGFRTCGRSPLDGQGRPFPLLHMQLGEGVR
ncbi:MAG TPA: acetyltransferase [Noviherbaspirillum sp.]|jgi:putative acetyltransferase|uniref:acetyltransferase n=1 Tax=Noviherbaspirillum sp. TaxID=1926288 RepID=UPI002F95E1B4